MVEIQEQLEQAEQRCKFLKQRVQFVKEACTVNGLGDEGAALPPPPPPPPKVIDPVQEEILACCKRRQELRDRMKMEKVQEAERFESIERISQCSSGRNRMKMLSSKARDSDSYHEARQVLNNILTGLTSNSSPELFGTIGPNENHGRCKSAKKGKKMAKGDDSVHMQKSYEKLILELCAPLVVNQLNQDIGDPELIDSILENLIDITKDELDKLSNSPGNQGCVAKRSIKSAGKRASGKIKQSNETQIILRELPSSKDDDSPMYTNDVDSSGNCLLFHNKDMITESRSESAVYSLRSNNHRKSDIKS